MNKLKTGLLSLLLISFASHSQARELGGKDVDGNDGPKSNFSIIDDFKPVSIKFEPYFYDNDLYNANFNREINTYSSNLIFTPYVQESNYLKEESSFYVKHLNKPKRIKLYTQKGKPITLPAKYTAVVNLPQYNFEAKPHDSYGKANLTNYYSKPKKLYIGSDNHIYYLQDDNFGTMPLAEFIQKLDDSALSITNFIKLFESQIDIILKNHESFPFIADRDEIHRLLNQLTKDISIRKLYNSHPPHAKAGVLKNILGNLTLLTQLPIEGDFKHTLESMEYDKLIAIEFNLIQPCAIKANNILTEIDRLLRKQNRYAKNSKEWISLKEAVITIWAKNDVTTLYDLLRANNFYSYISTPPEAHLYREYKTECSSLREDLKQIRQDLNID